MGAKAKQKAKAKGKAKASAAQPPEPQADANELHGPVLLKVHDAIKQISDHPVFEGIAEARPLTIAQGGRQMPFDAKMALKALDQGEMGSYKCACNLFHHNLVWLAEHRIPLNQGQIKQIQSFSLPPSDPPSSFPYVVTVAVDAASEESLAADGHWHRLSPAEPVFALLLSIQQCMIDGGDEVLLKRWRKILLTVDYEFEVLAGQESRYWRALNLREAAVELGQSVRLSLRQRIFDIAGFKKSKELATGSHMSAKKLAQLYGQQLKLARGQEELSEAFIDCACSIAKRIFGLPKCQALLEECDALLLGNSNPWNKSIYSLQAVLDRAQGPENIVYALEGMMDGFKMGFLTLSDFAPSKLKDYRTSNLAIGAH